ncbi:glutamate--cysteine ligase [Streptomyces sp. NPDC087294]|uniref:glutamate--cysteine ligase n=1 Tax=Streptomyces sp. NPDC087294 TaxID=3365777 RepID=UPI003820E8E7
MGLDIDQETFTEADFLLFRRRLGISVGELKETLTIPGFGDTETSVGAELEMFLMHADGRPAPLNGRVRDDVRDPRVVLEVDRFDLEANLTPVELRGRPFTALRTETDALLAAISTAAHAHGAHPVTIGTLPTLTAADLHRAALTPCGRFQHIERALSRCRSSPYLLGLGGEEPMTLLADSIAVQGANCSWQVHLVVAPAEFTRTYNAAQLATGPVLAAAGNSPLFLGRRLWQETRIPLYEQGFGDGGGPSGLAPRPRASFGRRWLDGGVVRLFADAVRDHDVLIPVLSTREPAVGATPWLDELRLHQGTVWTWNRPVYDPGGHVRIEFRALPSGPTSLDMAANAAFLLGLTLHLARQPDDPRTAMPFESARGNFYRAARSGLRAKLCWPSAHYPTLTWSDAGQLLPRLLPLAAEGLVGAGVDAEEAGQLLAVIAARVAGGQTGAVWQQRALSALEERTDRRTALRLLTSAYTRLAASGAPVHTWPTPTRSAGG